MTINVNCAVIVVSLALCFWVEWVASLVSKSYMISFYSQTAVHLVFVGSALVIGLLKRLKFSLSILLFLVLTFICVIATGLTSNSPVPQLFYLLSVLKGFLVAGAIHILAFKRSGSQEIYTSISVLLILQWVIGVIQLVFPDVAFGIFQPNQPDTGYRIAAGFASWDGSLFGSFVNQVSFAYFSLFALLIMDTHSKSGRASILFVAMAIWNCLFSQSLAALIILLGYVGYTRLGRFAFYLLTGTGLTITFVSIWSLIEIAGMPLESYVEVAKGNRLGILLVTLPSFFESPLVELMLGYGYGTDQLYQFITTPNNSPVIFEVDGSAVALQDVSHVAVLTYFGLFGITLYILIPLFYFLSRMKSNYWAQGLAGWLAVVFIWLGLFNQILNITTFAVMFFLLCMNPQFRRWLKAKKTEFFNES